MQNIYEQNIIDNYKNPINFGKPVTFNKTGRFANLSCGDEITVYMNIDHQNIVTDVKFTGSGCALSVATMSILSEKLIGKSLEEVLKIEYKDLIEFIGVTPNPARSKCVLTGMEALRDALK
ncbi:MAG: iron-sulfur cluster assembly scaffold protein [bacterium]